KRGLGEQFAGEATELRIAPGDEKFDGFDADDGGLFFVAGEGAPFREELGIAETRSEPGEGGGDLRLSLGERLAADLRSVPFGGPLDRGQAREGGEELPGPLR